MILPVIAYGDPILRKVCVEIDKDYPDLAELIEEGFAFMTSGCPGEDDQYAACNRPLANERPSEDFRNYPFIPDGKDRETIKK